MKRVFIRTLSWRLGQRLPPTCANATQTESIMEDQEINDLTKSVRFAHTQGYREVLILGATGLREDHTLGNISLLMDYAHLFKRVEMLSDYGLSLLS